MFLFLHWSSLRQLLRTVNWRNPIPKPVKTDDVVATVREYLRIASATVDLSSSASKCLPCCELYCLQCHKADHTTVVTQNVFVSHHQPRGTLSVKSNVHTHCSSHLSKEVDWHVSLRELICDNTVATQ